MKFSRFLLLCSVFLCSVPLFAVDYVIDDFFPFRQYLPVHSPVPDWNFYGTSSLPGMSIAGSSGSSGGINYVRATIAASGSGWARFGRLVDISGSTSVTIKARASQSLPVTISLWDDYARIDLGGWSTNNEYEYTFTATTSWQDITIPISGFQRVKGADPLVVENISALVVMLYSPTNVSVDIGEVVINTSISDSIRRYKEFFRKQVNDALFDIVVLENEGFDLAIQSAILVSLESQIDGLGLLSVAAFEANLVAVCKDIDDYRLLLQMKKRINAIEDWIGFTQNASYVSQLNAVKSLYNTDKTNGSPSTQLDIDISGLWQNVWSDVRDSGIEWHTKKDKIVRSDGKVLSMFGANDFQSHFSVLPSWYVATRREDFARMAEIGLNTVRIVIRYDVLESQQGVRNDGYAQFVRQCAQWAAEYGIFSILDLHFNIPDWIMDGPVGYQSGLRGRQHIYAFKDALRATHQYITSYFDDLPSVIGQEVPYNEPTLMGSFGLEHPNWQTYSLADRTIAAYPWLLENWNQYLQTLYNSNRSDLATAWQPDIPNPNGENGLRSNEDWNTNTIMPPGVWGDDEYTSTRLYDYLRWTAHLHAEVSSYIAEGIKQIKPSMLTFQQQMIGGQMHSVAPIPLALEFLHQYHYNDIDVMAAHYNAGAAFLSLPAVGKPWYQGEIFQDQNWKLNVWEPTRDWGGNIIFWAYSSIPDLSDNLRCLKPDGRLKDDRHFLPLEADDYKLAHQSLGINSVVGIIINPRLAAIQEPEYLALRLVLDSLNIEYEFITSMFAIQRPLLLQKYDMLFSSVSYLDPEILFVADASLTPTMFIGDFDKDIYAREYQRELDAMMIGLFSINCSQVNSASGSIKVNNVTFYSQDVNSLAVMAFLTDALAQARSADLNYDGTVNFFDMAIIAEKWKEGILN